MVWIILLVVVLLASVAIAFYANKAAETKDELMRVRSVVVMLLDENDDQAETIESLRQEVFDALRARDDMKIVMGIYNSAF